MVLLSHRQSFVICNWWYSAVAWTEPQLRSRASRDQRKHNEFHQCRFEIRDRSNLQFVPCTSDTGKHMETPVPVIVEGNVEGKIRPLLVFHSCDNRFLLVLLFTLRSPGREHTISTCEKERKQQQEGN